MTLVEDAEKGDLSGMCGSPAGPSVQCSSSSPPFRIRCLCKIRQLIPANFMGESRQLALLAAPLTLSQVLIFLIIIISSIFCGHLGKMELDAVTLANAVVTVTGVSVGTGFSSACDTLISQTYGSSNFKRIGVILQKGILLQLLLCLPCWSLFIHTENILLLVHQDPEVARLAQSYALITIPSLPAVFIYQLEIRYLQNQGIIMPQIITGIAANILNAVINYIFLFVLNLGVPGSACANTIAQYTLAILLFLYIRIRKLHVRTWGGWSWECLQDWGSFTALAIPSMLIVCFEWWIYEIGSFLAGIISVIELGAQSVLYQVATLFYMVRDWGNLPIKNPMVGSHAELEVPYGVGIAASVRVGNALGAGNIQQAKSSALVALYGIAAFIMIDIILLSGLKNNVAQLFTNEKAINALTAHTLPAYIVFHIFESIACVANGVLRGTGKQLIGAVVFAVGYYAIALPLGVALMFPAKLGIVGLWSALAICGVVLAVSMVTYISKINWKDATLKAQERAGVALQMTTVSSPDSRGEPELKNGMVMAVIDQDKTHSDKPEPSGELPQGTVVLTSEAIPKKELLFRRGLTLVAAVVVFLISLLIKLWVN